MNRAFAWVCAFVATLLLFARWAGMPGADADASYFAGMACFWWLVADREERQKGGAR